jgi:hypothetical protein
MNFSPKHVADVLGGEIYGKEILVPGPGHSPKDRSLSIRLDPAAPDGFLAHSFAGDDPLECKDYARDKLGIRREAFQSGSPSASIINTDHPVSEQSATKPQAQSAEYIYKLADGAPYLRVKRSHEKQFYQSHWNGRSWENGAPKGPKIPYRLPELLKAEQKTVLVVEGEKDADALAALGFTATTNSGGAEKFSSDLVKYFKGRDVYVLPDNDEPGKRHAKQVSDRLTAVARSVRIVPLPGLPSKGDVSDWIAAGGTADQLVDLLHETPVAEATEVRKLRATPFAWKEPTTIPRRDWLYGRLLLRKFVSATISPGGLGKSSLVAAEALAQVSGRNLLGVTPAQPLRVWLWNLEDPQEETDRKIMAAALHFGLKPEDIGDRLFVDSGRNKPLVIATATRTGTMIVRPVVDDLIAEIIARKIDIIKIDPFVSCHEVAENDNQAMDMIVKEWGRVADAGNCAVHLVHHTPKMAGIEVTAESARGGKSFGDACRVVRPINRMSKEEGDRAGVENHRLYFRSLNDKANLQPPADKSEWFKLTSVDLGNGPMGGPGDSVGVVTAWQWPDPLADVTGADFDKVAAVIRRGQWRENVQAAAWVGKAVAEALDLDASNKADKAKITGMLAVWRAAGSLVVVEHLDEKRERKKFVEVREVA